MTLSSLAVRRPVSIFMCVLSLLVFGVSSIFSMQMESTPEMNMPVLMIRTTYTGASPQEVDSLVTDPIESALSTVSEVSQMSSRSSEGSANTTLSFDYSVDLDKKKEEVKQALEKVRLPDSAGDPSVIEMSMDSSSIMSLSIHADSSDYVISYIEDTIVPELERISGVASVDMTGGSKSYVQILLKEEALHQYGLTMNDVVNTVSAADFTTTAGEINRGEVTLSLQAGVSYQTWQSLEEIPISLSSGNIIHLSDVATVSKQSQKNTSISRYNGKENISISISKNQSANTIEICNQVAAKVEELNAAGLGLTISITDNSGQTIYDNIMSVVSALLQGLAISMFVLFLFLGDWRAAVIVAVSMPLSVFAALVLMSVFDMTINLMSLGGLVVGIGMMVDNSIVVMESCFRNRNEIRTYEQSAVEGANLVYASVIASTITTIVVFLPISLMDGMAGQLFKQVGFTIVFSMTASLVSALTMVPLLFVQLKPVEKLESVVNRVLSKVEGGYARLLSGALNHRYTVMAIAVCLLMATFWMYQNIDQELMSMSDEGAVNISITTKTGLNLDATTRIIDAVETVIAAQDEVDSYSLSSRGGGSASVAVYLKDTYTGTTDQFVDLVRKQTADIENCSIEVSQRRSMSFGSSGSGAQLTLTGENLTDLETAAEQVRQLAASMPGIASASTSLSSGSPRAVIEVDAVSAAAIGMTPSSVVSTVKNVLSGVTATTLQTSDQEYSVKVEYPPDRYQDVSDLSGLMLTTRTGGQVPLTDVATITYSNSPSQINRSDGKYNVTVTGQTETGVSATGLSTQMLTAAQTLDLPKSVSIGAGSNMRQMNDEFSSIGIALLTAIFLVFVVMSMQFESCRFSLVVMISIPFSMTGAMLALLLTGNSISMTSLIGLIMLVGIVVNNAIVLIDYTSYLRKTENLSARDALVLSGRTRLRPILMTTLTTVFSLIPMATGFGGGVEMMQSMAVVVIGGLTVSTLLTLVLVPVFYLSIDREAGRYRREARKLLRQKKKDCATASDEVE